MLHVGANLARARNGRSFYYRPAPHALIVDVRDAGELHIYQGGIKLAAMKGGRLYDQIAYSALEFLPTHRHPRARASTRSAPGSPSPGHEPAHETSDFHWTALLNTVLCIINGVKEHNHGGTVLLVSPDAAPTLPIHTKFDIHERVNILGNRFVHFLNARHQLADAKWRRKAASHIEAHATALSMLENAAFDAEEQLGDAADSRRPADGGGRRIGHDVRPAGPGIRRRDRARHRRAGHGRMKSSAIPIWRRPGRKWTARVSACATVPRSAVSASRSGVAAFVVSQDNSVSFIWKKGRTVLLKKNVNTSNPNMVGA